MFEKEYTLNDVDFKFDLNEPKFKKKTNNVLNSQFNLFQSKLRFTTKLKNSLKKVDLYEEQITIEKIAVEQLVEKIRHDSNIKYIESSSDDGYINQSLSQKVSKYSSNSTVEFEELFDPSMNFTAVFICQYWDLKDHVRKGKILLTNTELLFKCSGMPFIKVRVFFSDINDINLIKNYKNQYQTVLAMSCKNGEKYIFYKFRMPKQLVRNVIVRSIRNVHNFELDTTKEEAKTFEAKSNIELDKKISRPTSICLPTGGDNNEENLNLNQLFGKESPGGFSKNFVFTPKEENTQIPKAKSLRQLKRKLSKTFSVNNLSSAYLKPIGKYKKKHSVSLINSNYEEGAASCLDLTSQENSPQPDTEFKTLVDTGNEIQPQLNEEPANASFEKKLEFWQNLENKHANDNSIPVQRGNTAIIATANINKTVNYYHNAKHIQNILTLSFLIIFSFCLMTICNYFKLNSLEHRITSQLIYNNN